MTIPLPPLDLGFSQKKAISSQATAKSDAFQTGSTQYTPFGDFTVVDHGRATVPGTFQNEQARVQQANGGMSFTPSPVLLIAGGGLLLWLLLRKK